jgi:hypothetical protein
VFDVQIGNHGRMDDIPSGTGRDDSSSGAEGQRGAKSDGSADMSLDSDLDMSR